MTYLEVPFKEKDQAKSLGARWDGATKKWYVPSELDEQLDLFQRWMPNQTQQPALETGSLFSKQQHLGGLDEPAAKAEKGTNLSIVLRNIQNALRASFPGALWVIAEISNINRNRGHLYLELSESNEQGKTLASCRAMIWQSSAERLLSRFETETGSELSVGQKVLMLAEVSFHEQYGFSFIIQDIDPSFTLGELEAKLNDIRKKLIFEGLYGLNKQLLLAEDFFRVAVIAPPAAAGLGDFRVDADILQNSGLCEFTYFYSSFQGEQVEKEMTSALEAIESLHSANPFDALVIIRGGGAKLDLSHLNIYDIAKRVCQAQLPVLTGIGHERDNTILDEVAHTRFDTPSKVIAAIRNKIFQQAQQAKQNWQHIDQSSRLRVKHLQQDIERWNQHIDKNSLACLFYWKNNLEPLKYQLQKQGQKRVQHTAQAIEQLQQHIQVTANRQLEIVKADIDQNISKVSQEAKRSINYQQNQIIQWIAFILSSGPKTQLNRGFAIAKTEQGKPIKTAKQAQKAGRVQLQFIDGTVPADIDQKAVIIENT
ncbi:MAG: exodeoxyribonuclease VII large subunit [Pseudomonadota bacterium]|nr:exodeoxyribonuclease VII large subunit [Pseudomonadota bacterium]